MTAPVNPPADLGKGGAYLSPGGGSGNPSLSLLAILQSYFAAIGELQGSGVRLVQATNLAATLTTSGPNAGVLTANGNGAMPTVDGVAPAVGDRLLLAGQTGNAGSDCGVYVVTSLGSGSTPWTMSRSTDASQGLAIPLSQVYNIGPDGTRWANSQWKATAKGTYGTNDPLFYPKIWKQQITLVAGLYTIGAGGGNEPLFLLPGAVCEPNRNTVGGTITSTIMYVAPLANRTAGKAGTGSLQIQAHTSSGAVNTTDTSGLDVLIEQW